eukprot:c6746_g1_i1.p2 GENE.c6746_g1_i1~~c6746_g1_i1.p2  ORF type:complete len:285 (-),score=53.02 c6746_g1_i1:22-876(-)
MSSADDLKKQLTEFQQNLSEIEELIQLDPTDESLQEMRKEILEGVKLTINLLSESEEGADPSHDAQSPQPGVQSPEQNFPPLELAVGDLVTSHTTNPPRLAEVVELGSNSSTVFIRLLGTGLVKSTSVSTTSLAPPPDMSGEEWEVGEHVQAVPSSTNTWTEAVIETVGTQVIQVKFLAGRMSGDVEWLPFARLHKSAPSSSSAQGADELKRVGKPHRQQFKQDKKRSQNQQAWQTFAQKNKRVKRSTEDSMFRSPETERGKVGVVGSDKDMTPLLDGPKRPRP